MMGHSSRDRAETARGPGTSRNGARHVPERCQARPGKVPGTSLVALALALGLAPRVGAAQEEQVPEPMPPPPPPATDPEPAPALETEALAAPDAEVRAEEPKRRRGFHW